VVTKLATAGDPGGPPFGENLLMEGTSGAADRVSFREGIREAALHSGGSAKAELCLGEHVEALVSRALRGVGISMPASKRDRDTEVPEPIGLGLSFHHEQSWWKEQAWD
jgi:hypothetical protein